MVNIPIAVQPFFHQVPSRQILNYPNYPIKYFKEPFNQLSLQWKNLQTKKMSTEKINKSTIATKFGTKAKNYQKHAQVQPVLLDNISKNLQKDLKPGQLWADIGCGPGTLLNYITIPDKTALLFMDIAFEPLKIVTRNSQHQKTITGITADSEYLPLKDSSIDGAIMASMLQWAHSPSKVMDQIALVLKDKGILHYAVFVKGSLHQLNQARAACGLHNPVTFLEINQLFEMADRAGFDIIQETVQQHTCTHHFPSAFDVLKSLSAIGATATSSAPLNRKKIAELCSNYDSLFGTENGTPVTYRAITGKALRRNR